VISTIFVVVALAFMMISYFAAEEDLFAEEVLAISRP
jgi:type IV secretory pathway TrbL component